MKLIVRTATFECLGDQMTFDVTIIIDENEDHCQFIFKPAPELSVKYAMPEVGFTVDADMKNRVKSIQILLPNPQLAKELSDCIQNYIKDFDQRKL